MQDRMLSLTPFRVVSAAVILCAMMSVVGEWISDCLEQDRQASASNLVIVPAEPVEANRVDAAEGFSMVAPAGWDVSRAGNRLEFVPRSTSFDSTQRMTVTCLEEDYLHPRPLPQTRQFQGKPAYSVVRSEPVTAHSSGSRETILVMERSHRLFELRYKQNADAGNNLDEIIEKYFQTFRVSNESQPELASTEHVSAGEFALTR